MNIASAATMGGVERFLRTPEVVKQWTDSAEKVLADQKALGKSVAIQETLLNTAKTVGAKVTDYDYKDFSSQRFFKLGRPSLVVPVSGWLIPLAMVFMMGSRAFMGHRRDERARQEGKVANEMRDVLWRDPWASFWFFFGMSILSNKLMDGLKKLTGIDLRNKSQQPYSYDSLATNFKLSNRNVMSAIVKDNSARHGFFKALPSLDKLAMQHESFRQPLEAFKASAFDLKHALAKYGDKVHNNPELDTLISKTWEHFKHLTETRDRVLLSLKQQSGIQGKSLMKLENALKIENFVSDHIANKVRLPLDLVAMGFVWFILGLAPVMWNKVQGDRDVAKHLQQQQQGVSPSVKALQSTPSSNGLSASKRLSTLPLQSTSFLQANVPGLMPGIGLQNPALAAMPFGLSPAQPAMMWSQSPGTLRAWG